MPAAKTNDYIVKGTNTAALFTLTAYRGDGMLLLAMDWKKGKPPVNFAGFSIEYMEPGGIQFYALKNRITFADKNGKVSKTSKPTLEAPIQMFRWVHFPRNADMEGDFTYKVKPAFMNEQDELSFGESQMVKVKLSRETYPGKLNVTYTRGFISSQAFADRYEPDGGIPALIPASSNEGLDFKPTHPKADEALAWMGFEARAAIIELLDKAIADEKAQVRMVAFDFNLPELLSRLKKLKKRLQIIIDDSKDHGADDDAETKAATILKKTATVVKRQHMGQLQHNKMLVVDGPKIKAAVCGSTNFSWRGFYVQSNNAIIVYGAKAIKPFKEAFDNYLANDKAADFGATASAGWAPLQITGIDASVSFSPHTSKNAILAGITDDIQNRSTSSVFYSFAFLGQTPALEQVVDAITNNSKLFVYGVSDRAAGGVVLHKPNGNAVPVYPEELTGKLPEPFKSEPSGGKGVRMHHKFAVIDFDKPTARVYMGSFNFSKTADQSNGENLLLIKDRKIAVSYMIQALTIFDHYHFRVAQKEAKKQKKQLELTKPPRKAGEKPWWDVFYTDKRKIRDREMFSK